jgi:hypothetical protein
MVKFVSEVVGQVQLRGVGRPERRTLARARLRQLFNLETRKRKEIESVSVSARVVIGRRRRSENVTFNFISVSKQTRHCLTDLLRLLKFQKGLYSKKFMGI